jgi:hypothetical protein
LTTAFSVDYPLVGALWVNYDVFTGGGWSFQFFTQGGKTMWPKYAGWYASGAYNRSACGGTYYCDNTLSSNADTDLFLSCSCFNIFTRPASTYPVALSGADLTAAQNQINNSRNQFRADEAVLPVDTTMSLVLNQGLAPEVWDWDNGSIFGFGIGHVVWSL